MASDPARIQGSDTGAPPADPRPPQLVLRFAAYSGLVLLLAGVAIFWLVQRDLTRRAEKAIETQAQQIAEATLSRRLQRADFEQPVTVKRRTELDAMFREGVFVSGVVRASLISAGGRITYSTNPAVIGDFNSIDVRDVLRGHPKREVTVLPAAGAAGPRKVVRTFVPVRRRGIDRPLGVLSLSQDYESAKLQTSSAGRRLALILFLALLVLYASLFPILRRVTAQLEARNRRLSQQADELSKLAAIVEESDDAIIATDLTGVVVSWNAGAERLFDYRAHEMIGRSLADVVPADRLEEFEQNSEAVARGLRVEQTETVRLRRDGTPIDVSLTISPLRDGTGEVTGSAGILRDITDRKRQEAQREALFAKERIARAEAEAARAEAEAAQILLTEQNERLRELDRLKDEFVSLVSHELRTPLTSISGYLELLLEGEAGDLSEEQRRFLKVADRNAGRLLHLVGDLLFLAQVDSGKLTIDLAEVELDHLVEECVEAARPVAAEKRVDLKSDVGDVPALMGDRERLAQLLDNLVSNAIKFTPHGGKVELRLWPLNGHAVLEIADTGIGIPPEEQDRLFERFFRSSSATEHAIQGTGLGLSIARAIVQRHNGRIELESTPGEGTTVRVSIPIQGPRRVPSRAKVAA